MAALHSVAKCAQHGFGALVDVPEQKSVNLQYGKIEELAGRESINWKAGRV